MRIRFATLSFVLAILAHVSPAAAQIKPPYKPALSCVPAEIALLLDDVERHFGPVQVISTHRPGAIVAGTGRRSKHADCRAVDFIPARGKYREVADWLKDVHDGGVGTYSCNMHHIHIDNGDNRRWHKCVGSSRSAKNRKSGAKYAARSKKNGKRES
jgi:uncharacterized protein YcbK (DUF882 family)